MDFGGIPDEGLLTGRLEPSNLEEAYLHDVIVLFIMIDNNDPYRVPCVTRGTSSRSQRLSV